MNIVRPIYKKYTQINQYEVTFFGSKGYPCDIVTVEVMARNYASAKNFVEKRYNPKQIYSVCLTENDIWRNSEGFSCIIRWKKYKKTY